MKLKALIAGAIVAAAIEFLTPAKAADTVSQHTNNGAMLVDSSASVPAG